MTSPILPASRATTMAAVLLLSASLPASAQMVFNRIASFPVFENSDISNETAAEIAAVSSDANTLIYSDSPLESLGFVDITDPANPTADGIIALGGEPTSVAVVRDFALVSINTSMDFVNPDGELRVYDMALPRTLRATIPLGGQPDAIAVSPDGNYAAIAIENERDEDLTPPGLGEGDIPQLPAGYLVIIDTSDADPANWTRSDVDLTGLPITAPSDPEPEYVDINADNIAAVSLQENNGIALVDLSTGTVVSSFSAGTVDLSQIDTLEEDPALITLNSSASAIPREPDGLTWINTDVFATADEGDWLGGSRGFTLFDRNGNTVFEVGNALEHEVVRLGHYPDGRSENKGNEPENVEYGNFGGTEYLFVGSERSSVIFVYTLSGSGTNITPTLLQTLPAGGLGPEGLLAIPSRNLFVASSENDSRADTFRSVISLYQLEMGPADYPDIVSANRPDGTPIPWGALSALVSDPNNPNIAYTVYDSFYGESRIFTLDIASDPAVITTETPLRDSNGLLANVESTVLNLDGSNDPVGITLVNGDNTVNLDPEGIAIADNGNFWIASEGDDSPFFPNMLIEATPAGDIVDVVLLPDTTRALIDNNGFEGVAVADGVLYVAFQRDQWDGISERVRIGRYDPATQDWGFFFYPMDVPTSPNGGWVGLSELSYAGNGNFLVIERDNQAGADATLKRIYQFNINGITPLADDQVANFPVVQKTLVRDLLPDLASTGGRVLEKVEGLALLPSGELLYVIDNDGVDDSNGETPLFRVAATGPLVSAIVPLPGTDTFLVQGQNLPTDAVVLVNGVPAMVTPQGDGSLLVTLPAGATAPYEVVVQDAAGAPLAATTLTAAQFFAAGIPTLSVWSMLGALLLLAGLGARRLRQV